MSCCVKWLAYRSGPTCTARHFRLLWKIINYLSSLNRFRIHLLAYVPNIIIIIVFWGNSPAAIRCFRMQTKIIRIMEGSSPRSSCRPRPMFHKLEILSLPSLYIHESILLVTKSICNKNMFFLKNEDIHSHNTRLKSDLFIQQCSTSLCHGGVLHTQA